jgi:fic protein
MSALREKESEILTSLSNSPKSLSELAEELGAGFSKTTVHRIVTSLAKDGRIVASGSGRSAKYEITSVGRLFNPITPEEYFRKEQDDRQALTSFNHELFETLLNHDLFSQEEMERLTERQREFEERRKGLSPILRRKEKERFAIDLSWKSSQIEGNTYTLLQTESLFKEGKHTKGNTKAEAVMLLNHQAALDYVLNKPDYFRELTVQKILEIHRFLTKGLGIPNKIRSGRVGITGTNYKPLAKANQIQKALQDLCDLINSKRNVLEKAFIALLFIAYIQPFEDGNKRTARIICNALLLANKYCPISFRTVEPEDYRYATLLFYEQNCISSFKKMFIQQFEFSTANYF